MQVPCLYCQEGADMIWLVSLIIVLFLIGVAIIVVFFIAAAIWGMVRGVKQLRAREVQVQDKTLPPPT